MTEEQRFCPNCGSRNVEFDTSHSNVLGEIIANQNKWLCNDCDYRGLMPVGEPENMEESPEDEQEISFTPVKQRKLDTALGEAYVKYLLYITLPALIIYFLTKTYF